ncbi:MAG: phosphatase PAP2 family protein [Halopenitus sp.]
MRGLGEIAIAKALPEVFVVLAALVTTLADTWFVFGALTLGYWFLPERWSPQPRRRMGTLMALATCTLAAVTALKHGFAVPRPGGAATPEWLPGLVAVWFENTVSADGFGFPSGHAAGATILYGGLVFVLDWADRRRRTILFGTVAVAVAFSRVALQVHYLVDIVAGAVLGVAVLFGGLWLAGGDVRRLLAGDDISDNLAETDPLADLDPTPVFLVASAVGAGGVVVSIVGGYHEGVLEGAMAIGTALGGAGAWQVMDGDEPTVPPRLAVPGFVVAGGLWLGALALKPPVPVAAMLATLGIAIIIGLPALQRRI